MREDVMWTWDYELRTLGSWPSERYNGHNMPVEVVTKADHDAALRRAKAEGEDEVLKLRIYTRTLQRALRNCHMLARRQSKKEKQLAASAWPSIIRFCEEVGITQDGVLRADARAAQIEANEQEGT